MNRTYLTIVLLGAGSLQAATQSLDGCPAHEGAPAVAQPPSGEAIDHRLQSSGVSLTRESLTIALRDSRPNVRSLAALELGKVGQRADVTPLLRAWMAEGDSCTGVMMRLALGSFLQRLAYDPKQHPGDQPYVTPFQSCAASESAPVSLNIEQGKGPFYAGLALRVTARNLTSETLPFLMSRSPAQLFSVTVLDPNGVPAKVAKVAEMMFEPVRSPAALMGHGATFLPLPPGEDVSWTWIWRIGEEFDMSAPGTYRVSLGGRVPYLDTTVCSNTAEIRVEKQP